MPESDRHGRSGRGNGDPMPPAYYCREEREEKWKKSKGKGEEDEPEEDAGREEEESNFLT